MRQTLVILVVAFLFFLAGVFTTLKVSPVLAQFFSADINGDGIVNFADFGILIDQYNTQTTPPTPTDIPLPTHTSSLQITSLKPSCSPDFVGLPQVTIEWSGDDKDISVYRCFPTGISDCIPDELVASGLEGTTYLDTNLPPDQEVSYQVRTNEATSNTDNTTTLVCSNISPQPGITVVPPSPTPTLTTTQSCSGVGGFCTSPDICAGMAGTELASFEAECVEMGEQVCCLVGQPF